MISLSLSDFIKSILNIQDNNISSPEEYCKLLKKIKYFSRFSLEVENNVKYIYMDM